jgi:hypothetical protein
MKGKLRHSSESWNPASGGHSGTPAFAGVTAGNVKIKISYLFSAATSCATSPFRFDRKDVKMPRCR